VRDAKISHLGRTIGGKQDVGWLKVAVDDAACVGVAQPIADLGGDANCLI
jgi:hypothetical protein